MKSETRKFRCFKSLLLAAGFGFLAIFTFYANAANDQQETKYHFLRHAEFDKEDPDKPLSDEGEKRAQALVEHFKNNTVDQIYSTHTDRTYDTVAALAKSRGISIVQVPKQGESIDEKVVTNRSSGKVAISPMIEALGEVSPGESVVVSATEDNGWR